MHICAEVCLLTAAATAVAGAGAAAFAPDKVYAEKNAHAIFNSVHSAGRQWGSSIYHNGFAMIPAIVPRGSIFYHGTTTREVPAGPARLAFEPEAAEAVASDWYGCRDGCKSSGSLSDITKNDTPSEAGRNYVHIYRNKRNLKLLLLDGMSAGETNYGTLDTQDLVLLEGKEFIENELESLNRAQAVCKVVQPWGYDGFIRAGVGFEMINCNSNITESLTQMKVKSTFSNKEKIGDNLMHTYQWARAAAQRYDGLGARLKLDFSSMVSGLFYPVNTTNPDHSHPEFKRLAATAMDDLRVIKNRVAEVGRADFQTFLIDWRYIVDTIVERFSDRLAAMVDPNLRGKEFIDEIEAAAISYIDAAALQHDAEDASGHDSTIDQSIKDCMDQYLYPALPFSQRWNQADHMLYHSVITVMNDICGTLIHGWIDLHNAATSQSGSAQRSGDVKQQSATLDEAKLQVGQLVSRLGWTPWRKTRPCPADETMFVAMWPYGSAEDHSMPGCRKRGQITMENKGYWNSEYTDVVNSMQSSSFETEEL